MEQIPLAVRVEKEGKQIAQAIVSVPTTSSFQSIVARVIGGLDNRHEKVDKIYTGSKSMDQKDLFAVEPTSVLRDAVTAVGTCTKVLCKLKSTIEPPKEPNNAFHQMMKNASAVVYPDKKEEKDGRAQLYNCVVQYLQTKKAGFDRFQKDEMQTFMNVIVSALWYLDGQSEKIALASGVPSVPNGFCFTPNTGETFRVLIHGNEKKKTLPRMTREDMIGIFDRLDALCATRLIKSKSWSGVRSDVEGLRETFAGYINHLNQVEDRTDNQTFDESNLNDNRSLKTIPGNKSTSSLAKLIYKDLHQFLIKEEPFTPVNLILYAPFERKARYKYIQGLTFEFDVNVYRSFKPNATFVWRLPEERSELQIPNTIIALETDLVNRIKDDKVKRAKEVFGGLASWNDKNLNDFLTVCSGNSL